MAPEHLEARELRDPEVLQVLSVARMWVYRGDDAVDPENLEGFGEKHRTSTQIGADLDDTLRPKFGDDQELGDGVDLLEPTWDLLCHAPGLGETWVLCRQEFNAPLRLPFV